MLDARISAMIEAGALDEARRAWDRCPDVNAPGWSGIGCAELLGYLMGEHSLDQARALWFRNTRAYAKRQLTWFKRNRRIRWFRPGDANSLADAAEEFMSGRVP
jgi:tRNA dimethylallyltransferase